MSLVVWLPLNGNSENQGTKQYTETINTLEYTSNGKTTNKCMNLGRLQYDKNPLGMVGSICFWIYPKSTDEGSNSKPQPIFGNDNASTSSRKWTLYLYSNQPSVTPHSTSLHSWGCQKDGNSNPNGDFVINGVLKESAWNHVCVTHDLDYEYIYINGVLKRKVKWDSNGAFTFDVGTPIIYGDYGNYESNYRLNDFRIYNHCLTQSEVSEIAKGLMLHYSFENPYTESTVNLSNGTYLYQSTSGSDDIGNYFIQKSSNQWNAGLWLKDVEATGGNYYTWSLEVNPNADIYCKFDNNYENTTYDGNDSGFDIVSRYSKQFIPKNTWTKIWLTIYTHPDSGSGYINHAFCPSMPSDISECKVYYRNSMVEKKNHMTPYTSSNREAGLIRDNSGMGNDGIQVYQREEIPIESITPTSAQNLTDTISNGTHTIKGFNGTTNQCIYFGKIKYNPSYHYVGATVCYEFDLKVTDMTTVSGQTPKLYLQGTTNLNDGTNTWYDNPIPNDDLYKRINNGKNGTYHICLQKKITLAAGVTNVISYGFGVRFDYIKSGTITISNLHAYYDDLDTSKLTIADKSAIGSHSLYLNGKNYINCGTVTPSMMDEFTASIWLYRDDWTIKPMLPLYSSFFGVRDNGGFAIGPNRNIIYLNFEAYYNSIGYLYPNVIDMTKLSTGWHLITGVADKNRIALYLDGELYSENVHNKNAQINMLYDNNTAIARMPIYVGAELENWVTTPSFRTMKDYYIDDIRLYSTALSDEDIKALYNVKTRIDNKSNLLCNQLIETKQENLASDLSKITDFGALGCNCNINYDTNNRILTFTLTSNSKNSYVGPYILNKYYGGQLITNKTYRYSIYVKFSKSGTWKVGEERIINSSSSPFKNGQEYEAGKWYKIENEGVATAAQVNFIFYYCSGLLEVGDKIEIRDFKMYRLYNDENYNPGPNIKGQYKTFELNETFNEDVENSGATIVDKYGAEWLEVFYHNTNNNTVWFTDEQEALHTNSQYKFSILDQLENFRGADNKFEFLLEYSQDLPGQYNRWKQTDNPATTQEDVSLGGSVSTNGYEEIHIDWSEHYWGGLLKSQAGSTSSSIRTLIDGSVNHNNWYYSIGCYNNSSVDWENAMPGPNNTPSTGMKEVHLYVRIDNLPNKNEIFRQYKRQTKTKEIIEI